MIYSLLVYLFMKQYICLLFALLSLSSCQSLKTRLSPFNNVKVVNSMYKDWYYCNEKIGWKDVKFDRNIVRRKWYNYMDDGFRYLVLVEHFESYLDWYIYIKT